MQLSIHYTINDFISRVRNVIRWLPIIWKDRDWDYRYIYTILETKLKHQAKYIGDRDFYTEAKRDASRMMICVKLIQKLKEEVYESEFMDYHVSNYHWDDCEDMPGHKELRIEEVSNTYDDYFMKYPSDYRKVIRGKVFCPFRFRINDMDDKHKIAMNMSYYRHRKARQLLFTILERDIEKWWD